jgi:hypothetical protein
VRGEGWSSLGDVQRAQTDVVIKLDVIERMSVAARARPFRANGCQSCLQANTRQRPRARYAGLWGILKKETRFRQHECWGFVQIFLSVMGGYWPGMGG